MKQAKLFGEEEPTVLAKLENLELFRIAFMIDNDIAKYSKGYKQIDLNSFKNLENADFREFVS